MLHLNQRKISGREKKLATQEPKQTLHFHIKGKCGEKENPVKK